MKQINILEVVKKCFLAVFVTVIMAVVGIFSIGSAYAAGSIVVSVEPASGSFQTGSTNTLNLYGTTSGANTSGFSFTVTLVNMTISSFDATGNPFSLDSVSSGGTVGSTSATITVGYSSVSGGGGKLFVGKLITVAGSTAGTATAKITAIDAYDANLDPMPGTASNGSYTLTKPATPTTTPTTPTPTPTKTPTNTVTIPTPGATTTVGDSKPSTVPEPTASLIVDTQGPDVPKPAQVPEVSKKKKTAYTKYIIGGVSFIVLLALLRVIQIALKRKRYNKLHFGSYVAGSVPVTSEPQSTPDPTTISSNSEQLAPKVIEPETKKEVGTPTEG